MKRLLTIPMLIVGSTLLVACQTPDGPDEPTVTAEPTSGPAPTPTDPVSQGANIPQFTLQTDSGERLGGTPGGYCWGNECLALEVQPEPKEFHNLPYGPLVVEFDGQIPGKVYLTLSREGTYGEAAAQTEVTPDAPWVMWDPQVEPGQYVLAVNAYWENDDNISYYFGLRITPPETHTLDLPRPPAAFLITPDGQRIEGITGSYCWNGEPDEQGNMTAVCADMAWLPVHEVFAPLAAGQPIVLEFNEMPESLSLELIDADALYANQPREPAAAASIEPTGAQVVWEAPPVPPGRYLVRASGTWRDRGSSGYSFGVKIE